MPLQSLMHVQTNRDGVLSRRSFLRTVGGGAAGLGLLGWRDALVLQADELRRQGRACILLFMQGGPSQLETFDPKPGTTSGGPTEAISTAVNGVRIAADWPQVARQMGDLALIRSLTNREGEHARAVYQLHTGYAPGGAVRHPSLGAVVAREVGPRNFDLPSFVSVGSRVASIGAGFLGTAYAPFVVFDPNRMPANAEVPRSLRGGRFSRRLDLMHDLEQDFADSGAVARVQQHATLYDQAARLVRSPRLRAFDLSQERDTVRDRYGRTAFGQGCLLARRLVEEGVTFVEVESTGWDTHRDNFTGHRTLAGQVDPAFATLVGDLRERGLLERTLVIWMGEFGRTPRINATSGRDHFPRAFNAVLAGSGIRGGRVVGATSANGMDVVQRPVTVPDLFCTYYQALGINPRRENMTAVGRPIRLVDGGQPVRELFS
jgi:hypothetical protein